MEHARRVPSWLRRPSYGRVVVLVAIALAVTIPPVVMSAKPWQEITTGHATNAVERTALDDLAAVAPLAFDFERARAAASVPASAVEPFDTVARRVARDVARIRDGGTAGRLHGACASFPSWRSRYARWARAPRATSAPDAAALATDAGCFAFEISYGSPLMTDADQAVQELASVAGLIVPGLASRVAVTMSLLERADARRFRRRETVATASTIGYLDRNQVNIGSETADVVAFGASDTRALPALARASALAEARFQRRLEATLAADATPPGASVRMERLALAAVDADRPLEDADLAIVRGRVARADVALEGRWRAVAVSSIVAVAFSLLVVFAAAHFFARRHDRQMTFAHLERDALTAQLARSAAERSLSLTEGQLRAVFETADVGIAIFDDARACVQHNRKFAAMRESIVDLERIALERAGALLDGSLTHSHLERAVDVGPGARMHLNVSLAGVYDAAACRYVIATIADVTDAKDFQDRLRQEALRDGLTGLGNRRAFELALADVCEIGARPFALFFIDLDRFKPINDRLGHAAGDAVLSIVASRLRGAVGSADVTARIGGDEFAILARDVADRASAETIERRLVLALDGPIVLGDETLHVTASIGVAVEAGRARSPAAVLARADAAMYAEKRERGAYRTAAVESALASSS